ncbi:hypothetical protein GWK47_026408 [Chionoecetes opilio]|uniref:Uncharacterized protein n=1 Tax=Chionoecetes opilio TaxID=41210 RepID=A0A8J8WBE3_CHIOP|nr:hypothetical protein GWK47_026408 [Chionoecetes opilio]
MWSMSVAEVLVTRVQVMSLFNIINRGQVDRRPDRGPATNRSRTITATRGRGRGTSANRRSTAGVLQGHEATRQLPGPAYRTEEKRIPGSIAAHLTLMRVALERMGEKLEGPGPHLPQALGKGDRRERQQPGHGGKEEHEEVSADPFAELCDTTQADQEDELEEDIKKELLAWKRSKEATLKKSHFPQSYRDQWGTLSSSTTWDPKFKAAVERLFSTAGDALGPKRGRASVRTT